MANTTTKTEPTTPDAPAPEPSEDERLAAEEARAAAEARAAELERENLALREQLARAAVTTTAASTVLDPDPTAPQELPAEEGGLFRRPDAFRTWRVVARNRNFTGETEGVPFNAGVATITALPAGASDARVAVRLLRLNNLRNYDAFPRVKNERTGRLETRREVGYQVLTPEQYDARFADVQEDADLEIPADF